MALKPQIRNNATQSPKDNNVVYRNDSGKIKS